MRKALIIAADLELGSALANWLALDEFETTVAWDSFTGLELAHNQHPALILCDVNMPELDGFAVLEQLRSKATEKKPVIVLLGQLGDSSRAFAAGADGFLFKSAALSDLLRSIRAYTTQIEENREAQNSTQ